jgi:hypothetical protein
VFQPLGYAVVGLVAAHLLGVAGTLWGGAVATVGISLAIVAFPSIREVEARPRQEEPEDS